MPTKSIIKQAILIVLDENGGELQGTEKLQLCTNAHNKTWFINCVRVLEENGQLQIINAPRGGRGNRTVYKRNRNQPGLPRQ